MSYTLLKLLASGTFTTGIALDWRTQFAAAPIVFATPTLAGEILYPGSGTTYGVYGAFAFSSSNPFDATICLPEASAGAPVQVWMNGALVSEVASPGTVSCPVIGGSNVFEVVRAEAPLVVVPSGPLIDPLGRHGRWLSLFGSGSDPFSGGGGSSAPSTIGA
jgi:hypothetical protein